MKIEMDCAQVNPVLDAYIDGELDVMNTNAIQQHLETCASCRAGYEEKRALRAAIKAANPHYTAPRDLERRIRSRVRTDVKTRAPRKGWTWGEWKAGWRILGTGAMAASLGVTLVLGAAIGGIATFSLIRSPADMLVQESVADHIRSLQIANRLTDVASSDQHTVKPWFIGKLDFAPPVRDLTDQGFPLIGGRLDYLANRTVAALAYRHRQHVINLFIWPANEASISPINEATHDGYAVLQWTDTGMRYLAVSDLNRSELVAFAEMLRNHK